MDFEEYTLTLNWFYSSLQKVQSHQYQSKDAFVGDVELIYLNSSRYNGKDNNITGTARKMLDVCKAAVQEVGWRNTTA